MAKFTQKNLLHCRYSIHKILDTKEVSSENRVEAK